MQDRIERTIDLAAPVSRVWRAITDHEEFGTWFRVLLDGPFAVGEISRGRVTYPGHEHLKWRAEVIAIEPESRFVFEWCPLDDDPDALGTEAAELVTRVEFRLAPIPPVPPSPESTRLTIVESGFASLPDDTRRLDALRRNEGGWDAQTKNIRDHVESNDPG